MITMIIIIIIIITIIRKPLTCGNSCKVKCLRKGNPKKSLVNGNPL